jgi:hypothetical protein
MGNKMKIFACLLLISLLPSCNTSDTALVTRVPTRLLDVNIRSECPTIEPKISGLTANGTLILGGIGTTYLLDMSSTTMTEMSRPNESLQEFSVSPNQRWIAYYEGEFNQSDANLIVAGVNNQIYKTLPWESAWGAFRWLDNERLIIRTIPQSEPNSVTNHNTDFLVFNPFTGERQTVKVDYPNIYNLYPLPDWDGWGVTVYNQTLTQVVYLEGDVSGPLYYVLWDLQKKSQITNLQIVGDLDANPRWSPDGEQFAVAPSLFSKMKQYPSYELYSVTKDGDTKQLTYLADYYPWVYIADLSWSPDSRYIAFWFSHWQQSESPSYQSAGDRYLAVLDTETGLVTDYCINGENDASIGLRIYPPPLWSPDSKQVVIQSQVTEDSFKTILIDIQENRAVHIADDLTPVGWMVSP